MIVCWEQVLKPNFPKMNAKTMTIAGDIFIPLVEDCASDLWVEDQIKVPQQYRLATNLGSLSAKRSRQGIAHHTREGNSVVVPESLLNMVKEIHCTWRIWPHLSKPSLREYQHY
jgi:hypothetical protein